MTIVIGFWLGLFFGFVCFGGTPHVVRFARNLMSLPPEDDR